MAASLGRHIARAQLKELELAARSLDETGAESVVERWFHSVETTANRAGLLLAAELDAAEKVVTSESGSTPVVERHMDDLLVFAASEAYFQLRAKLGLDIKVGE